MQISRQEYKELRRAALRIKEARLSDLTDEEAGRWLKRFAAKMDSAWQNLATEREWNDAQLMVSRATHQALDWVKTCIESNSGTLTLTLIDTTVANKPAGDWEIRVRSLPKRRKET